MVYPLTEESRVKAVANNSGHILPRMYSRVERREGRRRGSGPRLQLVRFDARLVFIAGSMNGATSREDDLFSSVAWETTAPARDALQTSPSPPPDDDTEQHPSTSTPASKPAASASARLCVSVSDPVKQLEGTKDAFVSYRVHGQVSCSFRLSHTVEPIPPVPVDRPATVQLDRL
jgi:hypothetical protein